MESKMILSRILVSLLLLACVFCDGNKKPNEDIKRELEQAEKGKTITSWITGKGSDCQTGQEIHYHDKKVLGSSQQIFDTWYDIFTKFSSFSEK